MMPQPMTLRAWLTGCIASNPAIASTFELDKHPDVVARKIVKLADEIELALMKEQKQDVQESAQGAFRRASTALKSQTMYAVKPESESKPNK